MHFRILLAIVAILQRQPQFDKEKLNFKSHAERQYVPKRYLAKQRPQFHRLNAVRASRHVPVGDEPLY